MIVEYNPERLKPQRISILQFPGIGEKGFLTIRPGNNDIPLIDLKALLENTSFANAFQQRMDDDIISIKTVAGVALPTLESVRKYKDTDLEVNSTLTELIPTRAVREVDKCDDVQLLLKWKNDDTRAGVIRAIDQKLDKLGFSPDGTPNIAKVKAEAGVK